jgi:glycine/D-amino acid oxidase-like deaminating enzyme
VSRRFLVIGAGLVGACAAWRIAQAGGEVTILDQSLPCSGASGTSFAWVGTSYSDAVLRPEYFQLKLEASRARKRMATELGERIGLHQTGLIVWSNQPESAAVISEGFEKVREAGVRADLISPAQADELEPEIKIPSDVLVVGYRPDDGYITGPTMVAVALRAARGHGAVVRPNTRVVEILQSEGKTTGVRTESGEALGAEVVVVAAGAATGSLVATAGGLVPLVAPSHRGSDAIGLIVTTDPCATLLQRVVVNDEIMFRPDGGGRLLLHSFEIDQKVSLQDASGQLLAYAEEVAKLTAKSLPEDVSLTVNSAKIGVRPLPVDGLSVVGPIRELKGLYTAVTHSGITLGPLLGELVAEEVFFERPVSLLDPFRPDRFTSREAAS